MQAFLRSRVTVWVVLGALGIAAVLSAIFFGLITIMQRSVSSQATPTAAFFLTPAPTLTQPAPTPTLSENGQSTPAAVGGIAVDMFVQITGTGGDGLRLRSGAGRDNPPRFLGYEAEVFRVKDGPVFADGLTWWFLEAPYDPERAGWAAADYLAVVTPPQ